jgi:hypothetical protein
MASVRRREREVRDPAQIETIIAAARVCRLGGKEPLPKSSSAKSPESPLPKFAEDGTA